MSIQKKSLISTLKTAKRANLAKDDLGAGSASVSPAVKNPVRKLNTATKSQLAAKSMAASKQLAASKNALASKQMAARKLQ